MNRNGSPPNQSYKGNVKQLKAELHHIFGDTNDLALVNLRICGKDSLLCYLTTMTNSSFVMDNVINPLIQASYTDTSIDKNDLLGTLSLKYLSGLTSHVEKEMNNLPRMLNSGYAAIVVEDVMQILFIDVNKLDTRAVSEPTTQNVVRGPKEGFTESAATNMSLIRRRIANEKLRFDKYEIGEKTSTPVYLA